MNNLRGWCVAALSVGCGRISFDQVDASDGNDLQWGDVQAIACTDVNLGSALGRNVASGTTVGHGDDDAGCSGDGPDVTFGWFAPHTARYLIDLCASSPSFDSQLYVRSGSCSGALLACDNNSCGNGPSLVFVNLMAGQGIVIVIDGDSNDDAGSYQLAITQLTSRHRDDDFAGHAAIE